MRRPSLSMSSGNLYKKALVVKRYLRRSVLSPGKSSANSSCIGPENTRSPGGINSRNLSAKGRSSSSAFVLTFNSLESSATARTSFVANLFPSSSTTLLAIGKLMVWCILRPQISSPALLRSSPLGLGLRTRKPPSFCSFAFRALISRSLCPAFTAFSFFFAQGL